MKTNILQGGQEKQEVEFTDISHEIFRQYEFPDFTFSIQNPLWLHVSKSGGHRVVDAQGVSHYIPSGWRHLWWESKKGTPPFVA